MKLAFSNIGWSVHDDPSVLARLRASGVTGIEVAPTKIWPDWQGATVANARAYATRLAELGFSVPAMQAILFGRPELRLFGTADDRRAFTDHVTFVADLANALGARAIVYGAPKSRAKGERSLAQALDEASVLFADLGAICTARDTCLCIEPNPVEYGCDFVTNAVDALALVSRVGSPGFGLHLDAAALHLAHEDLTDLLPRALPILRHFHVSEPFLSGYDASVVPHSQNLRALTDAGYAGWISAEIDEKKHSLDHSLAFLAALSG